MTEKWYKYTSPVFIKEVKIVKYSDKNVWEERSGYKDSSPRMCKRHSASEYHVVGYTQTYEEAIAKLRKHNEASVQKAERLLQEAKAVSGRLDKLSLS